MLIFTWPKWDQRTGCRPALGELKSNQQRTLVTRERDSTKEVKANLLVNNWACSVSMGCSEMAWEGSRNREGWEWGARKEIPLVVGIPNVLACCCNSHMLRRKSTFVSFFLFFPQGPFGPPGQKGEVSFTYKIFSGQVILEKRECVLSLLLLFSFTFQNTPSSIINMGRGWPCGLNPWVAGLVDRKVSSSNPWAGVSSLCSSARPSSCKPISSKARQNASRCIGTASVGG